MNSYNIGDRVLCKHKKSKLKGMIIDVLKNRPEQCFQHDSQLAFIVQRDDGYKLLVLQSEIL